MILRLRDFSLKVQHFFSVTLSEHVKLSLDQCRFRKSCLIKMITDTSPKTVYEQIHLFLLLLVIYLGCVFSIRCQWSISLYILTLLESQTQPLRWLLRWAFHSGEFFCGLLLAC